MTVSRAVLLAASLSMASAAFAQTTYQQERARCLDGSSGEDQKTCLREAGAAVVEAKRGGLTDSQDYQQNAMARCAAHTNAEERSYCERRMRGEGTVSGSVKGGGLMRELTVVVPADQK